MAIEHDLDSELARAVRAVGSQSAFGRVINRRQSTVREWLKRGTPLPAENVAAVEAATGISRHELRPDIFGPPPETSTPPVEGNDRFEAAR